MRKALYEKYIEDLKNYNNNEEHLNLLRIYLFGEHNLDADQISECITDGFDDNGIDAVYIDDNKKILYLIQSKFDTKSNESIKDLQHNNDIKSFYTSIEYFISENNEKEFHGNLLLRNKYNEFNAKADAYAENEGKEYTIKNIYLVSRKCEQEEIEVVKKKIYIYDVDKIYKLYRNIHISETYPDLHFAVKEYVDFNTDDITSKICVVSIKEFVNCIENSGIQYQELLYENVRYAYSKSRVNTEIKKTLESEDIKHFYLYNNGITMLCDRSAVKNGELHIINASIINGGQTTFEMLNSKLSEDFDGQFMLRINTRSNNPQRNDDISINLNNQNQLQSLFIYSKNEIVQNFKKNLEQSTDYFLEIKQNEFININPEKKLSKNKILLEDIIRVFIIVSKHETSYTVKNTKKQILADADLVDSIINKYFNLEIFNKYYPIWNTVQEYVTLYRKLRRNPTISNEQKIKFEYDFINTSNYLIFYTICFHYLENITLESLNVIIDKLYTIHDLNNGVKQISQNTQSKEVYDQIKKLDFSNYRVMFHPDIA